MSINVRGRVLSSWLRMNTRVILILLEGLLLSIAQDAPPQTVVATAVAPHRTTTAPPAERPLHAFMTAQ
eukprot:6463639-Amphidinium_carterae.1